MTNIKNGVNHHPYNTATTAGNQYPLLNMTTTVPMSTTGASIASTMSGVTMLSHATTICPNHRLIPKTINVKNIVTWLNPFNPNLMIKMLPRESSQKIVRENMTRQLVIDCSENYMGLHHTNSEKKLINNVDPYFFFTNTKMSQLKQARLH